MEAELEEDRRHRLTNLVTLKGLSPDDYFSMREYISYESDRTSSHSYFWTKEQELIYFEFYTKLSKFKVCPQKALDLNKLKVDYFKEADKVVTVMGLHQLMTIKCNYNIELVQQFFATLVLGQEPNIPMTWMTKSRRCHSDFVHFAQLLGYPFRGKALDRKSVV